MKILVCNDDGWQSPGITALYQSMRELAEVRVVAPDRNCSAASSSLTLMNPIRATQPREDFYALQGTPADCVNIALNGLFDWMPDLIVSGINQGANLGDDVIYSGTLAAAIEGVLHGVPGIAFSLTDYQSEFHTAARVAADLVRRGIKEDFFDNTTLLNVNIPPVAYEELQGYEATRLGSRKRVRNSIVEKDPRGSEIYWIGPAGEPLDTAPGTDFFAITNNSVSVTPVTTDLTNNHRLAAVGSFLAGSSI